jgi:hypothetical protein
MIPQPSLKIRGQKTKFDLRYNNAIRSMPYAPQASAEKTITLAADFVEISAAAVWLACGQIHQNATERPLVHRVLHSSVTRPPNAIFLPAARLRFDKLLSRGRTTAMVTGLRAGFSAEGGVGADPRDLARIWDIRSTLFS